MKRLLLCIILSIITAAGTALPCFAEEASPEEEFTDTSFQGGFTTETLDAIIEKYELYDGWYWTTEAGVIQDFHGHEGKPGWTDTAVNGYGKTGYEDGWYGCRWGKTEVNPKAPNDRGYGECFGFAQFIGYLLSGERNPQKNWKNYRSIYHSGGLKPGDIVRSDYVLDGRRYIHSAIVYSTDGDEALFIQVSGSRFNLIYTATGYSDGYLVNETSIRTMKQVKGVTVYRYEGEE